MNNIHNIWHHPAFLALGDMLLHSIWQIGLIGLAIFLILTFQRQLKPHSKADMIYGGMLLSLSLSVYTFISHFGIYSKDHRSSGAFTEAPAVWLMKFQQMSASEGLWSAQWLSLDWMKILTIFWIAGLFVGLIKFLTGMGGIYQFRKLHSVDIESELYGCFRRVSAILPMNREIKLKWSPSARAPFTFGFWSPVIVVPISFMSGYSIDQIECILAHEMAHIKRRDYLHNLIQYLIEAIFFFHPVMWFMVREMKTQREYACDEWVVKSGWNPFHYAASLTKIQSQFLVAESGLTMNSRNAFLDFKRRIQRIVLRKEPNPAFRTQLISGFSTIASFVVFMMYAHLNPVQHSEVCLSAKMDAVTINEQLMVINGYKSQLQSYWPESDQKKNGHVCFKVNKAEIRCFDLTGQDLCMKYSEEEKRWYLNQNGYVFEHKVSRENTKKPASEKKLVAKKTQNQKEYDAIVNKDLYSKSESASVALTATTKDAPVSTVSKKSGVNELILTELPEDVMLTAAVTYTRSDEVTQKDEKLKINGSLVPMTHKRTGTSVAGSPELWSRWVNSDWASGIQGDLKKAEIKNTIPQTGSNFSLQSQFDKESGLLIITLKISSPGIFGLRIMSQDNLLIKDWSARYLEIGEEQIIIDLNGQKHRSIMVQATCDTPAEKEERMLILNFSNVAVKLKANTWIPEEELYNSMPVPDTYIGQHTIVDDIERMLNNKTLVVATYHTQDDWVSYTQCSRKLFKASDCMAGIWNISIPEAFRVNVLLTRLKEG